MRVFEAAGGKQTGGVPQRYLGAYKVDPAAPYRFETAPDRLGAQRQVMVFRLIPDGPTIDSAADVEVDRPVVQAGAEIIPVEINTGRVRDSRDPRPGREAVGVEVDGRVGGSSDRAGS